MSQWMADRAYALAQWLDRRATTPESPPAPRVVVPAGRPAPPVVVSLGPPAALHSVGSHRVLGAVSTFTPVTSSVLGAPQPPRLTTASAPTTHVFHQWPTQGVRTSSTVNQYP